jgi:hypothetical protein
LTLLNKKKMTLPAHIKKSFKKEDFYVHLVQHVEKMSDNWKEKFANVVGVNITKKIRKKKEINRYAIIFYVTKKENVHGEKGIPKYISVTYNKEKKNVPTDVVETGPNELTYIKPGQNGFMRNRIGTAGTLGAIVRKNGLPHVLSNMHVIGLEVLEGGSKTVNRIIGPQDQINVNCQVNSSIRPVGILQKGMVNSLIDAAVAFIPPDLHDFINPMSEVFTINNPIVLPSDVIKNPFPVLMIGNVSKVQRSFVKSAIGMPTFDYPGVGSQTMFKIIQLSPCISEHGDSGSPVFEPVSKRIIGIVLGRDKNLQYTYVIPYQTVRVALEID